MGKQFLDIIIHKKKKLLIILEISIPTLLLLYFFLPYILFGENCVINIWDWLDSFPGWYRYIKNNHLLFSINSTSTQLDSLPTIYFGSAAIGANFTLLMFLHYFFPEFVAHTIAYYLSTSISFISMLFLLKLIFKNSYKPLCSIIAVLYAVLPCSPYHIFAAATLPTVILLFYKILTDNKPIYYIFVFLYPFVSEISSLGLFVCGLWFLAFVIISLTKQKIQFKLLFAFLFMLLGTVLVNFRVFYMRFVTQEPLNRDFFVRTIISPIEIFKNYFINGSLEASSLQRNYIVASVLLVFLFSVCKLLYKWQKNTTSSLNINSPHNTLILWVSVITMIAFSIIIVFDRIDFFYWLFSKICPPLKGYNLTRFYFFNRLLWYIAFCASLVFLWENSNFTKFVSVILVILQIHIVLTATVPFADSYASWKRNLEHGGKEKYITFKEFFSESQFDEIKKYINYDGENVAAYGYHPSVLMYNGFNCIDGYVSTYPYKDMLKFRTLIAPVLEVDEETKTYYDSWGGRRYLYPSPRGVVGPTREKHTEPIPLYINPEVFRNGYNGKYILSSYPISNANELGFELVKSFDSDDSIYIIYVYEMV